MQFDELTEENLVMFAMKHYDITKCLDTKEFFDDLQKVGYIQKLFYIYKHKDELRERLILNHLITFYNVFESTAATRILFFKLEKKYHSILKTFLLFMNKMPDYIPGKESTYLNTMEILLDDIAVEKLRKI